MLSIDLWHFHYLQWFMTGLVISLGLGALIVRLRRGASRIDSILMFVLPPSLFILAVKCLMFVVTLDQADWLSGRLAPAVAILHGYSPYSPRDSGAIFNTIYAPMAYLVYLPAGLFGDPTAAILAGTTIAYLITLAPILLLCLARHGEEDRNRGLLIGFTVFLAFWKFALTSAMQAVFTIHADAPAICFGVLSCVILYLGRREAGPSHRTLLGSALCLILALWSKQTALPLLGVLPIWVGLAYGPRVGLRFVGWIVASGLAISSAFATAFGMRTMLFNMLEIPKSHPWLPYYTHLQAFFLISIEEFSVCLPAICVIGALLYLFRRGDSPDQEASPRGTTLARVRTVLRGNQWTLFAAVGCGMIPFSLLSRIKVGGEFNNYSFPLFYLSAAACVLLLDWEARTRAAGFRQINDMIRLAVLVSPFSPLLLFNFDYLLHLNFARPPYMNYQEIAFQYADKHPGDVYFPWNPLSSLMAEGKPYHFEYGVVDRDLGGFQPSVAHFHEGMPEKTRIVAYPPNRIMEYSVPKHLPEFNRRVEVAELPGWICYERR